jgi:hypothetical protein
MAVAAVRLMNSRSLSSTLEVCQRDARRTATASADQRYEHDRRYQATFCNVN